MRATYKYKVYTSKRNQKADELFGLACWVYNHCIALHKRFYRLYGKYLNKFQLQKHLTKLKKQAKYSSWSKLSSQSIQQITEKIDDSYKRFFKHKAKRPPTFRGRRKYKFIKLRLKFFKSRELNGEIKTITIKQDSVGDLWICFSLNNVENKSTVKPKTGKTAGFDFGLKTFLTCSDGATIESPRHLFKNIDTLRSKSRNLSKKVKGSHSRAKAKLSVARLHRKVSNQRSEFHWQIANQLVNQFDVLYFEDLHIKAMQMMWGRKISDLAFSEFLNKLEYLCVKHNRQFVKIGRFFASSKRCSCCGNVLDKLELSTRTWTCPCCNAHHHRDVNAAINIKMAGASAIVGETVRPALAG